MQQVVGLLFMHESNYEATVVVVMKYMESRKKGGTTLISLMFDKGTVTTVRVVLKKTSISAQK